MNTDRKNVLHLAFKIVPCVKVVLISVMRFTALLL